MLRYEYVFSTDFICAMLFLDSTQIWGEKPTERKNGSSITNRGQSHAVSSDWFRRHFILLEDGSADCLQGREDCLRDFSTSLVSTFPTQENDVETCQRNET